MAATSLEKYLGTLYRQLGVKRDYVRKAPPKAPQQEAEAPKAASGAYLDDDIRQALAPVLARLERPITLRLYSDNSSYAEDDRKLITWHPCAIRFLRKW